MGDETATLHTVSLETGKDVTDMDDIDLGGDPPAMDDVDLEEAPMAIACDFGNESPNNANDIMNDDVLNNLLDDSEPPEQNPDLQPEEPVRASSPRKENPFDKIKHNNHAPQPASDTGEHGNVENNLDGMDCSLPLSATPVTPTTDSIPASPVVEKKKQPMVVSVGTIDVAGTFPDKYEDINIMKKGDVEVGGTAAPADPPQPESNDYESLRDVRFSSVSIYDKPHFEEDIDIVVDDAQKHQAESFVSYKVVTKTTRESWTTHEFHVRRRYQDFLWLANTLTLQYPTHIIPPLPQKKMFNRYDPDFLRLRGLALNKFLCRIAEHPILSTSEHFFTFLSAKQVELLSQKKLSAPKGFNLPSVLPIGTTTNPFETTSEYITEFSGILSSLTSLSSKLEKEQLEQIEAMKTLPPTMSLWANVEGDLEPVLVKVGETVTTQYEALEEHVSTKEEIFNESIKEYQLYVNLVKGVLKHRDGMQITKEYYNHSALTKQAELEKLEVAEPGKSFATLFGKSPAAVKEDKIKKLKKEIADMSTSGEEAGDALVVANANIKSDLERWKINKEKDCRRLLDSVADSHIQYYQTAAESWSSLIEFIDNTDSII